MGILEGKRILVISPQPWDHIHLSKHHYALELARRGNDVFFLDPPDNSIAEGIRVEEVEGVPRLKTIRYRRQAPLALRFHMRPFFDRLQRRQVEEIKRLAGPFDVVWCFDFNSFSDLRVFGAALNVFHPVDPVTEPSHQFPARTADIVLSVSEQILSSFKSVGVPRFVIDHGLSLEFAEQAVAARDDDAGERGPKRVGYAGNLARRPLDRGILKRMVQENDEAEFHFWGPAEPIDGAPAELVEEVGEFTRFLEGAPNVKLNGAVSSERLAADYRKIDCFVMSYSLDATESDRSNAHKLIEYLSTGKVVVSSLVTSYADRPGMLRMASDGDDSVLPGMLRDTLAHLDEYNSPELQRKRREFALDHTYRRQIERIEELVTQLPPRVR